MYAIVEIAGQQFKIEKDQKLFVNRLPEDEGASINIDKVLLLGNGDDITLGAPAVEGAFAEAKVLGHLKGDKVIVFKKKRRKGFRKKNGHRQYLTEIQISSISASGGKKKETAKKATPKKEVKEEKEAPKKETKKAAPKAEAKKSTGKADDLKKIEGVGPKIASTLNEAGIITFADLAKAKPAKIAEIISDVRGNHVPDTWPKQAQLAADGKWDELKELQDRLDGGVEK